MANQDICKQCGTVIDAGDPSGLCAQCGSAKEGAGDEPVETLPTRPAGVGNAEDNAEIKVRR